MEAPGFGRVKTVIGVIVSVQFETEICRLSLTLLDSKPYMTAVLSSRSLLTSMRA